MILLDMRTLVFSNMVTDIVCLLVILFLWYQSRKRFAGLGFWVFDFTFQTMAFFLITLRGSAPDWMSMVLASTLIIGGTILGYIGLGRFVGKKTSQTHNYILLAAFFCVQVYFALVQPNLAGRNLNISMGLLIIYFQCMWLLVYRVEPGMRRLTLGVGMVFGVYCLFSIVRIVGVFVITRGAKDFFQSSTFQPLVFISYQVMFILLTYSLVLMVNKRLFGEVAIQEEKFAKAFQSSPYAVTLTRLSDGEMIEVNDGFLNITGYQYAEAIGRTVVDLDLWDKDEVRLAVVDELSKSGKVQGKELQFRKKSGEVFTGLLWAEIISINNQEFVLSSVNDITERKRAEDALRESEEKYRRLVKYAPAAIYEMDLQGTKFLNVNEAMCNILGYSMEELLSTKPTDLMDKESRSLFKERIRKKEAGERIDETIEYRIQRKDGQWIDAVINVGEITYTGEKPTGVVVVGYDITERKRMEEQLRQAEEKSRLLIKYAPSMLYEIDFRQTAFKSVNDAMCEFLGYTRQELLAMSPFDLLDDEGKTVFQERIRRKLAGEDISNSVEYKSRTKDGREVYGVLNMTFTYKDRKPEGAVVVAHDITERKRAEEALRKAHQELEMRVQERTRELEAANRDLKTENEERLRVEMELRESETHLRHLSSRLMSAQEQERKRIARELHDGLGQSLTAIKFKVESFLQEIGRSTLKAKAKSLQEVIPIIQQCVRESHQIQMNLRPAILDDLGIGATLSWLCREFEATYSGIRIQKQIEIKESDVPEPLKMAVYRISQEALNNISKHSEASLIHISLRKTDRAIELSIEDNGRGFDLREVLSREDSRQGIGLSSMRERAELIGGTFSLGSSPGKGTKMQVTWPS